MRGVSAQQVWGTTRWRRRPGSPELRFRQYLYQGVYTDPDGESRPCGDEACFHLKRSAARRCAARASRLRQRAEQ